MRVLVTGATGFVGRHVVTRLVERGHEVRAVARTPDRLLPFTRPASVELVACDLHQEQLDVATLVADVDALIHLAWPGLPNYHARFHFEHNLWRDYAFLKGAVESGLEHVLVTGTCLEYGMVGGAIPEDAPTSPMLAYPLAKDTLHRFLQLLRAERAFTLQWVRLFYLFGTGQNPKSLLSQLDCAIDQGATSFDMSGGEQLRDYLPVTEAARVLVQLLERPDIQGAINCCSGYPTSVRRLVERRIAERNANLSLNLGVYPYLEYEPMAFWGSSRKLALLHAGPSDKVSSQ